MVDHLDLIAGEQSKLVAAKALNSHDKVKLVVRVIRQNRGPSFVTKYKFALARFYEWDSLCLGD